MSRAYASTPYVQLLACLRLRPRVDAARRALLRRREVEPAMPAGPVHAAIVIELVHDARRVFSRERYGNALLPPQRSATATQLLASLAEIEIALDAFETRHAPTDDDPDAGDPF